ncbi:MAG: hypothetical protein HWD82_04765 [Flavobacteriaceae bacterium]|nr:hypothetical protein [Flavobacteriaceae bacterium]
MIRLIAILLSQLVLLQSINFKITDFKNIEVFLTHAKFHQEKYGDSFLEFFIEHYADSENTNYEKHEEHKNLPFKNELNFTNLTQVVINLCIDIDTTTKPLKSTKEKSNFYYKEPYSDTVKKSIFQPPKYS